MGCSHRHWRGFLIVPGLMLATGMLQLNAVGSSLFSVGMFGRRLEKGGPDDEV